MIVQVFGTSFEFHNAPRFIQHAVLLRTAHYGTDLDAAAPVFERAHTFSLMRKHGSPGTPLA